MSVVVAYKKNDNGLPSNLHEKETPAADDRLLGFDSENKNKPVLVKVSSLPTSGSGNTGYKNLLSYIPAGEWTAILNFTSTTNLDSYLAVFVAAIKSDGDFVIIPPGLYQTTTGFSLNGISNLVIFQHGAIFRCHASIAPRLLTDPWIPQRHDPWYMKISATCDGVTVYGGLLDGNMQNVHEDAWASVIDSEGANVRFIGTRRTGSKGPVRFHGTCTQSGLNSWLDESNNYSTISKWIGFRSFTGSGVNDMTAAADYTPWWPANATISNEYIVEIDGTGTPDTFKWSDDGGVSWAQVGVPVSVTPYILPGTENSMGQSGPNVVWATTTGHTLGDRWQFSHMEMRLTGLQIGKDADVLGSAGTDNFFDFVTVKNGDGDGLTVKQQAKIRILEPIIDGAGAAGIYSTSSDGLSIIGGTVKNTMEIGIDLQNPVRLKIQGTKIEEIELCALLLYATTKDIDTFDISGLEILNTNKEQHHTVAASSIHDGCIVLAQSGGYGIKNGDIRQYQIHDTQATPTTRDMVRTFGSPVLINVNAEDYTVSDVIGSDLDGLHNLTSTADYSSIRVRSNIAVHPASGGGATTWASRAESRSLDPAAQTYGNTAIAKLQHTANGTSKASGLFGIARKDTDANIGELRGVEGRVDCGSGVTAGTIDVVAGVYGYCEINAGVTATKAYGVFGCGNAKTVGTVVTYYAGYFLGNQSVTPTTGKEWGIFYPSTSDSFLGGNLLIDGYLDTGLGDVYFGLGQMGYSTGYINFNYPLSVSGVPLSFFRDVKVGAPTASDKGKICWYANPTLPSAPASYFYVTLIANYADPSTSHTITAGGSDLIRFNGSTGVTSITVVGAITLLYSGGYWYPVERPGALNMTDASTTADRITLFSSTNGQKIKQSAYGEGLLANLNSFMSRTWQNVFSSPGRASGTEYPTTAGGLLPYPIELNVMLTSTATAAWNIKVSFGTTSGVLTTLARGSYVQAGEVSVITITIPANHYYKVEPNSGVGTVSAWTELR